LVLAYQDGQHPRVQREGRTTLSMARYKNMERLYSLFGTRPVKVRGLFLSEPFFFYFIHLCDAVFETKADLFGLWRRFRLLYVRKHGSFVFLKGKDLLDFQQDGERFLKTALDELHSLCEPGLQQYQQQQDVLDKKPGLPRQRSEALEERLYSESHCMRAFVTIDLKRANFQCLRHVSNGGISPNTSYTDWVDQLLQRDGAFPVVKGHAQEKRHLFAECKRLRQRLLGQPELLPGVQEHMQVAMMRAIMDYLAPQLQSAAWLDHMFVTSKDEVALRLSQRHYNVEELQQLCHEVEEALDGLLFEDRTRLEVHVEAIWLLPAACTCAIQSYPLFPGRGNDAGADSDEDGDEHGSKSPNAVGGQHQPLGSPFVRYRPLEQQSACCVAFKQLHYFHQPHIFKERNQGDMY
jgi:hypothetical protein